MFHPDGKLDKAGLLAAVAQAADAIVVTDSSGGIQYVNPAFVALTGYSREEVIGQNPRILNSGSNSAELYQELWNTIRSGNPWQGELINRRKDGSVYHQEMQGTT